MSGRLDQLLATPPVVHRWRWWQKCPDVTRPAPCPLKGTLCGCRPNGTQHMICSYDAQRRQNAQA